jgi:cell wall-associated NlpC family hydrolase
MTKLDPRLHAYRADLADARLEGRVEAGRFVHGQRRQVIDPVAAVYKAPRFDAMQLTQALMGETVLCFVDDEGWSYVQLDHDGYVGYVASNALSRDLAEPTHRVSVPATFLYPAPNLKTQPVITITMNAGVTVIAEDGKFARLSNGRFVYSRHIRPTGQFETDFVAVAEQFRHVPYLWGGKSAQGLDCSGLVQLAVQACGIPCRRDSDMQEQSLGSPLLVNDLDGLTRGDLVFWNGHVGVMTDAQTLLHANGFHMMVVAEPLREAVDRIAQSYGRVTCIRRF